MWAGATSLPVGGKGAAHVRTIEQSIAVAAAEFVGMLRREEWTSGAIRVEAKEQGLPAWPALPDQLGH